ncbi:transient receptor potential cation channel trpm isoform X4 [Planococcus citri]|uniref:transient receptor potential cation channel trpm isoform X4 n=1 Tax=Planococcus citri TaxID=170843 RepID=UPI0031F939F4
MKSKNSKPAANKLAARSWIEATFYKRECAKFLANPKDPQRCCCGLTLPLHSGTVVEQHKNADSSQEQQENWSVSRHTVASPTDAYGTIEFQGGPHPTKAQYVRLAYDSRPELILQLFTREWTLELPKLLITVQGGKANFELQPKLKKILRKGLLKAAKTTGAWIFTGGTNTGVTRQVGDALLLERSQRSSRVVSIGIAPWGIVENNHELIGHNKDAPYHSISLPRSKLAVLNNRHAYFLLVDNGTSGRYGAEIILRRKLEKYISIQKLHPGTHCSTPVVCLVIEGGTNTIRAVLEYVTDTPPVPVVVCDGSGRAADLIAFTHKYASESGEQTVLENMKEYLLNTIQRTFEVGVEQAECLYQELLECTKRKNLITVFRISDQHGEGRAQELDQTILTALFKSQHLSPSEQLSLALTWNRVDIARSEIFVYGQEWPMGALEEAMMQALEHDRIDFVKLLLENGVSMKKFLTIPRLEELYNTKQGPSNTLGYILRDVRPHIPRGYMYTLHDIGLVINKLMGGAYRAQYTRRKFRLIYTKVMKKSTNSFHRSSASFIRYYGNPSLTLSLLAETLPTSKELPLFDYPFNELLIWAVLTKRQEMALLMWQHGEEALAKALIACKLYKAMAHEAAEDDLETEIYEELRSYGKVFEDIALELLDYCYREDDDQTQQLLTCELQNWSGQTCLSLAVAANHRALLSHPCSQIILADLWMGGLRTRKNTNIKIIIGLLCPPYIAKLEFKSKEELQLMPQTEEEHLFGLDDENESIEEHSHDAQHRNTEADIERPNKLSIRRRSTMRSFCNKALISNQDPQLRDTVVTENGKVITGDSVISSSPGTPTQFYQFPYEYNFCDVKRHRPLRLKRKLYEFYTAPITKFWANSMAYVVFLLIFSYVVLVKMNETPSWQELYVIAYICSLGCEKIREIVSSEPVAVSHKFAVWAWNMWNPCDASAIIFFLIGLSLRLQPSSKSVGRVLYCVDIIYWYLRILNILGVNKYLGPLVTMMGKMVKNMIYFVVLLLVVLMSFGVCRQSILNPNEEPSWTLAKNVVFQPYFMLYGEVFADQIDPECGKDPNMVPCLVGRWIPPIVMAVYLLVANILLINLLIAVFNNIFIEVNAISHQVWMFQRFTVVMEYEQKPTLPPPFIFFSHVFFLLKYLKRKIQGVQETYDNGLKLFLDKEDLEQLYDFEEECVEGYFREKETKLQMSTEEKIKQTADRAENIQQKVEDINQKENNQNSTIQGLEFRIRKMEELSEQTLSSLSVIHRFMSAHSNIGQSGVDVHSIPEMRLDSSVFKRMRHTSEHSEIFSEMSDGGGGGGGSTSGGGGGASGGGGGCGGGGGTFARNNMMLMPFPNVRRKGPVRSMTEVRPSITSDSFYTCDVTRQLKDSKDPTNIGGIPITRESSLVISTAAAAVVTTADDGQCSKRSSIVTEDVEKTLLAAQRISSERQKTTSFSLDGGEDNTRTLIDGSTTLDDVQMKRASGSLGCLDQYKLTATDVISNIDGSGVIKGLGSTRSDSCNSITEAAMAPCSSRTAICGPERERSVTWAEPRIKVIPPSSGRSVLMAMHSEYTSITDELENIYGLLSPPRSPCLLSPPRRGESSSTNHPPIPKQRTRHASEMSNSEMAAFLEKETLRDAEESDYQLMEDLLQHRMAKGGSGDMARFDNNAFFATVSDEDSRSQARLQRSGAIEIGDNQTDIDDTHSGKIDIHTDPAELDSASGDVTLTAESLSHVQPSPPQQQQQQPPPQQQQQQQQQQRQHFSIEMPSTDSHRNDDLSDNIETAC